MRPPCRAHSRTASRPRAGAHGAERHSRRLHPGGRSHLTTRRLLVATGLRDEPIGIIAVGPASVHHALLFRQLTDDLVYFTRGTQLDDAARARFAARGIRVVDAPVTQVVADDGGGVRRAAGALAGAHMNADLVTADTAAALA